jgi:hypothetical protein
MSSCVEPTADSRPSPARIVELTWGFAPLFILKSALDHGVFDALDTKSKTIEELCQETGASERGLRAIINALVGMMVHSPQGDTYSFEEIAEWLGETGFVNIRSLGIPGPSPLILATKPR